MADQTSSSSTYDHDTITTSFSDAEDPRTLAPSSRRQLQISKINDQTLTNPRAFPIVQRREDVENVEEELYFPNTWARWRYAIREPTAEFLGTMILVIFGTGVDCQVVTSSSAAVAASQKGSYLSISLAWGIGTALGVWVSAGISGGHINPAVTLVQVILRRFPLRKLPIYVIAQVSGAFTGSLLVYANYWKALALFEDGHMTVPGTASLFTTFPLEYMSAVSCFFSEFLATAVLLIVVLAVTDKKNSPPPAGLVPLVLFLLVTGLGAALGMETAYAMNPARDLGPRLMTWIFYGREVWNYRNQYWLWTPILGPIAGALSGGLVYDLFLYTGEDSRINSPRFLNMEKLNHPRRDNISSRPSQADEKV